MMPHDWFLLILGCLIGYGACHFRPYREKRKRRRAIPAGTAKERKPKREKATGEPLPFPSPDAAAEHATRAMKDAARKDRATPKVLE